MKEKCEEITAILENYKIRKTGEEHLKIFFGKCLKNFGSILEKF